VGERTQEFQLQAGDTIVYSKFGIGATDLLVRGEQFVLIREDDCIGTMPRPGATAKDIPELKPVGDRVLLRARPPRVHARSAAALFEAPGASCSEEHSTCSALSTGSTGGACRLSRLTLDLLL